MDSAGPAREAMGETAQPVTVRQAVFSLLRSFEMTTIFGNPGSTELPMFRDFPSDFRYVLGLQESVAVAMADGYAQATRRPALINLHAAAGVGHALGSIFSAYRNNSPLVIVAGQQARSMLPLQPYLHAEQAAEFPKPYIKWSCEPARAEDVPTAIAQAYYTAILPPHGPTFVSVPVDDWDRLCAPVEVRQVSRSICGDPSLLAEAATALGAAARPVFVVGAGAAGDDAWEEVIALAERHDAPVWTSPMSARNGFPEDHPLFQGFLPPRRERIMEAFEGCDLILVIGAPVFTYHTEGTGPFLPEGANLIQIIDDPRAASSTPCGTSILSSVRQALRTLLNGPDPRPRAAPQVRLRPPPLPESSLISATYLFQQIAAARPSGSVIVEEAPSSRTIMHQHLPITERDGFYTCASGGLGYGLPAAVGVALGRPGAKIIAIVGDGSSMYSIQALWSAARLSLPVTFVIVNNRGYRALDEFGEHFGLGRDRVVGTKLGGIDFCGLAQAQGVPATRVSDGRDLRKILSEAFAASSPNLVEVEVE